MQKTLAAKLASFRESSSNRAFILADAKDADMAFGIAAPGKIRDGSHRSLADFRDQIREIVAQGLVDIMLMSASTSEIVTIREHIFEHSTVTPAVRANDTTDIHVIRGSGYPEAPSRPFSSATIDHIQAGRSLRAGDAREAHVTLGLYSITFNNHPERDLESLTAYKAFRLEAEEKEFKHFLEVFGPNVPADVHRIQEETIPSFLNDHIVRLLAGIPSVARPQFLKIPYYGPAAMEEICTYDPSLVVGVLGGSAGTSHDAFELLHSAKSHGARVALFGRKINASEHQLSFVEHLRRVADDEISPFEEQCSDYLMTKPYDVLAIGVAAVDDLLYVSSYPPSNVKVSVIARERHGGGPACTAIATVGTLEGRSAYCARLGKDDLSVYIERLLQQRHVDTTHIIRDSEAAPYHSSIVVDLHGNRNVFYDASMFRPLIPDNLADSLILSTELVLLDHVAEPALTEIATKIRDLGVPILGDIEGRSESALRLANLVDHLVVPSDFARWASNSANPLDACAYLAQTKRTTTVITAGSDGCYYTTGTDSSITHFPAFQVETFDTNGCGDTFHGAFALAVARNFSLGHAISFASAAAAVKASGGNGTRRGWNALPTLDDIILFLRSYPGNHHRSELLERIANIAIV